MASSAQDEHDENSRCAADQAKEVLMLDLHGISQESFDLIVNFEVSSRAAYDKNYRYPERPGGRSGITIGIGYDCGYSSVEVIHADWDGKIPVPMVTMLVSVA